MHICRVSFDAIVTGAVFAEALAYGPPAVYETRLYSDRTSSLFAWG